MLTATIFLMALGLLSSVILVIASKVFYVWEDPRIENVTEALLGANCGGCGYAGCAAAAEAVVLNKAKADVCVAGGFEIAKAVAAVMGMTVEEKEPEFSLPGCTYGFQDADLKYDYDGFSDCRAAMILYNGSKICDIGCLGLGTCVKACPFNALSMGDNNLPVVDNDLCTGCGICQEICPKGIITLSSATIRLMSDQKFSECTAPCERNCPAQIDIPGYIRAIKDGKYEKALEIIREKNPFALICGWICPAPCELECRRNLIDEPVSINALKKYVAELERTKGEYKLPYLPPVSGKKVSVIGGGVEGLTASWFLRRMGHEVKIFESTDKLGGILRYVITDDRLPKDALDWEIEGILSTGIVSRTGVIIGEHLTLENLMTEGEELILITSGGWDSGQIMNGSGNIRNIIPDTVLLLDFYSNREEYVSSIEKKKVVIAGEGRSAIEVGDYCLANGAQKVFLVVPFSKEDAVSRGLDVLYRENFEVFYSSEISELKGRNSNLEIVSLRDNFNEIIEIDPDFLILDSGRIPEMLIETDKESGSWKTVEILKVFINGSSGGIFASNKIGRPTDLERVVVAVGTGRKLARGVHLHSKGEEIAPEERVINEEAQVQNIFRIPDKEKMICQKEKYDPSGIFTKEMTREQAERCLCCGLICYEKAEKSCKSIRA